jgi:hypothetical protein
MAGFGSSLYKAARTVRTIESLGSPSKAARRAKNIAVGRSLARGGFWNWLWGGRR